MKYYIKWNIRKYEILNNLLYNMKWNEKWNEKWNILYERSI